MTVFTVTIALFVMAFVVIGNIAGRKVRNIDDYFVAGRRAPTFLIVGTLVASLMSTTVFMGEAGFTYAGQLGPYLLLPALTVTGYIYGALFFWHLLKTQPRDHRGCFFWRTLCQSQCPESRWVDGHLRFGWLPISRDSGRGVIVIGSHGHQLFIGHRYRVV